jgi:AraC-like DNA-binding protein
MPPPTNGLLLDPGTHAKWTKFQRIAADGVRSLIHWRPQDGMDVPTGQERPCHQHAVPTIIGCLEGAIQVIGRASTDLLPGDLLLLEPGCWHHQPRTMPGCSGFGIGFLAGHCDVAFFDSGEKLWGKVREQPYRTLVDALIDEDAQAERLRLVDEILGGLTTERIAFIDWIHPAVLAMAEYVWGHLHLRLDVDTMIACSGLRRTLGYRLFKEFFQRSPKQEHINQRLALAIHLRKRGFTSDEAAQRSGFDNRLDMVRSIRIHLGQRLADGTRGPGQANPPLIPAFQR